MSTIKVTNVQNPSAASAAIVLDTNGQATLNGLTYPTSGSLSGRNRIINGDMRIDQRNAGAAVNSNVATNPYTVDRWRSVVTSGSNQFSAQRSATAPDTFTNSLLLTSLAATTVAATDVFALRQPIEGFNCADLMWGTATAKSVTLSFWVRSSIAGTFGGALQNQAELRSYPFSYSIASANTWEYKTITIAGDTTGTWATDNSGCINVYFAIGMGSNRLASAGSWAAGDYRSSTGSTNLVATNGATFYITGVQLEAGSVATPFERRSYGQELELCQRYFCKTFNTDVAPAQNVGAVGALVFISQAVQPWDAMWRFPVQMRTTPATVTTYSTNQASANWSLNTDSPTASVLLAGDGGIAVRASTPAAAGRSYTIHASASAEL